MADGPALPLASSPTSGTLVPEPQRILEPQTILGQLCSSVKHSLSKTLSVVNWTLIQGENDVEGASTFVDIRPPNGDTVRISILNWRALELASRWDSKGIQEIDGLNEAIRLDRKALSICPPGYSDRPVVLNNLAADLASRYDQLGGIDDLNEAILLDQEALLLRPPGHCGRSVSLYNHAILLFSRYKRLGGIDDLNKAILLDQEALSLRPPGHPDRSSSLTNFAVHLISRYNQFGGIDDLNQAILLDREALLLLPPGHRNHSMTLGILAVHVFARYERFGRIDDLNEAIHLDQEVLALHLPGSPNRPFSLHHLAQHLSSRYNQLGGIDDMNQAILLTREALSLLSPGHCNRTMPLNNLAAHLSSRYNQLGGIDDLNEIILLNQEALSLHPPGHPDRSLSLINLAMHLASRYNQFGGIDDLNNAILLDREALSLLSPGHRSRSTSLSNLAAHLTDRYGRLRGIDDLNEAILFDHEALSLRPPGHPDRSSSLINLAIHLTTRFNQFGGIDDLNQAIILDREALLLLSPGHRGRSTSLSGLAAHLYSRHKHLQGIDNHNAAMEDERELFSLLMELQHVSHMPTSEDLSAARAWVWRAEEFRHHTTILAYETALRLLVENTVTLPPLPRHLPRLKSLLSSLAVDGFSACLRNQSTTKAVELLEQGRAIFWGQLTRLRSPLDDVIASGSEGKVLADEFTRLTSLIHMALHSAGADQHDRISSLNVELQKVVLKIRELHGHSRFLLPLLFPDLRRAATGGPVIIVNASKHGCDALVVFVNKDPVHVPLSVTQKDVQDLVSTLRALVKLAKSEGGASYVEKAFRHFLRELWDCIVSHIINSLQTACQPKGQKGVADLYVSSYTPTLNALIRARQSNLPNGTTEKRFVAIGQAGVQGAGKLLSVGPELTKIGQLVDGLATYTRIEGEESCISRVAEELGRNEWVHFACHGFANQEKPFESAFALHDGLFTIRRIIQCNAGNAEFAYLSACHTTVGDGDSPDENIHLASAMQFAGFRSVIGTMWAVADAETKKVTSMFYELMKDESGRLDYTRAARALRMTMRKVNIPMDQQILYIHLGA